MIVHITQCNYIWHLCVFVGVFSSGLFALIAYVHAWAVTCSHPKMFKEMSRVPDRLAVGTRMWYRIFHTGLVTRESEVQFAVKSHGTVF